jgi:hypothetical protein
MPRCRRTSSGRLYSFFSNPLANHLSLNSGEIHPLAISQRLPEYALARQNLISHLILVKGALQKGALPGEFSSTPTTIAESESKAASENRHYRVGLKHRLLKIQDAR